MAKVEHEGLIRAIKGAIGRFDERGNEVVDADEVTDEGPLTRAKRPTAQQKNKVVEEMLALDALRHTHKGSA